MHSFWRVSCCYSLISSPCTHVVKTLNFVGHYFARSVNTRCRLKTACTAVVHTCLCVQCRRNRAFSVGRAWTLSTKVANYAATASAPNASRCKADNATAVPGPTNRASGTHTRAASANGCQICKARCVTWCNNPYNATWSKCCRARACLNNPTNTGHP